MSPSFEEKSAWIQLAGLLVVLAGYGYVAGEMLSAGVREFPPYVAVFGVCLGLLVVLMAAGHAVAAITSRRHDGDERDRLIAWRAEARSSWVLGLGVLGAIACLGFDIAPVLVAHLLLLAMFASELLKLTLQLVAYRSGV